MAGRPGRPEQDDVPPCAFGEFVRLMATQSLRPRDVFGPLPTDPPQPTPAYVPCFFRSPSQERLTSRPDIAVQEDSFLDSPPTPRMHPLPEACLSCGAAARDIQVPRCGDLEHSRTCLSEESSDHPPGCRHGRGRYRDCRRSHHHFPLLVRWVALRKTRFGPKTDGRTHLTSRIPPSARSVSQRQLRRP